MKTKYLRYPGLLLFSLLMLAFTACLKFDMISEVDMQDIQPKLVVTSFISPSDTLIRVYVNKSNPINQIIKYDYITNAVVEFSSESGTSVLTYDSTRWCYPASVTDFPVLPGKTYNIRVSYPGCETVQTSTTVPAQPCTEIYFINTTRIYDEEYQGYMNSYNFKIKDIPGQKNFYTGGLGVKHYPDTSFYHYLYLNEDKRYLSDKDHDGDFLYFSFLASDYYDSISPVMQFTLTTMDENYYQFLKSTQLDNHGRNDPFSEPAIVYSNVSHGLGTMGSYIRYQKDITMK